MTLKGLPRSEVAEVQRARMLTAAVEVVSELGYRGMSTARVSGRAGVSRKTFYDLFADREDYFLAVFDDVLGAGPRVLERLGLVGNTGAGHGCRRSQVLDTAHVPSPGGVQGGDP